MITRRVFLTLLTLFFIQPSVTKAQDTVMGFCTSNVGQPVVYLTPIFDTKIPAQKLDQKVINCVSQNVIVTLQKKPQANHLQDFYKDAVAACNKSP